MFKDTPKGLLEAVLAVHKESREKFVQEQKEMLAKKAALGKMPKSADGKADPAAHSGAKKMAEELHGKQHKLDVAKPKGKLTAADFKALRMKKEEVEQIDERRSEGKPIPKMLGAGIPKRTIKGTAYGGSAQDYEKKDKAKPAAPAETLPVTVTSLNQAGKDVTKTDRGRRLLALQVHSRAKDRAGVSEEKDTPGNGYTHQCALHVKSEQYGEGRTLTSQHAEPDAQGHIAWYDVMFAEGIVRMNAEDLEILVSESHGNHKKMKK